VTHPEVGPLTARPTARLGLVPLGWSSRLEAAFGYLAASNARAQPGRVVSEERGAVRVTTGNGELPATLAGRLRHAAALDPTVDLPTVGDWVVLAGSDDGQGAADPAPGGAVVQAVMPRASAIVRRAPSDHGRPTQVLAANVDVAFLVTSLNRDFNLRRLERYLAVAWESGARPVVVLSKADLAPDAEGMRLAAEATAPGVDVFAVSAVSGAGLDELRSHLGPGRTVVFLGSSGVGKSSLVNALAGSQLLATAAIREDDARGRHTTTRRQLLRLGDATVIDTPGLRELALADTDGLAGVFDDLAAIAATCRFRDCRHDSEPDCAVRAAIADGRLSSERLQAFRKLEREARRAELAASPLARRAERKHWSAITKHAELRMNLKYGYDR
jgi:ribosome biogenesis GTPase